MGGCGRAEFPGAAANLLFLFLIVFVVTAIITPITLFATLVPDAIQPANRTEIVKNETEFYSNETGETPTTKR